MILLAITLSPAPLFSSFPSKIFPHLHLLLIVIIFSNVFFLNYMVLSYYLLESIAFSSPISLSKHVSSPLHFLPVFWYFFLDAQEGETNNWQCKKGSRGWIFLLALQDFLHFELLSKAQVEQMSMGSSKSRGKLESLAMPPCLTYLKDKPTREILQSCIWGIFLFGRMTGWQKAQGASWQGSQKSIRLPTNTGQHWTYCHSISPKSNCTMVL